MAFKMCLVWVLFMLHTPRLQSRSSEARAMLGTDSETTWPAAENEKTKTTTGQSISLRCSRRCEDIANSDYVDHSASTAACCLSTETCRGERVLPTNLMLETIQSRGSSMSSDINSESKQSQRRLLKLLFLRSPHTSA